MRITQDASFAPRVEWNGKERNGTEWKGNAKFKLIAKREREIKRKILFQKTRAAAAAAQNEAPARRRRRTTDISRIRSHLSITRVMTRPLRDEETHFEPLRTKRTIRQVKRHTVYGIEVLNGKVKSLALEYYCYFTSLL